MTTTVTTATISTVTVAGIAAALGLTLTIALVFLLVSRQLAVASPNQRVVAWGRTLSLGVIPLLISFAVIVGVRVAQTL